MFKQAFKKPANAEIGAPRWHSRGYLPHFENAAVIQHVTFHLADSLPQSVLVRLDSELKILPAEKRDAERRRKIEAWIDAGHGSCLLRKPSVASLVQQTLLTFDAQRYRLLEWVVMPNHVHVLFEPVNAWTVAKIVASWKKFTATQICNRQRSTGEVATAPIWHREYWDRFIRDNTHLMQAADYIRQNPVRAGLAATPETYPWSSANPGNANAGNAYSAPSRVVSRMNLRLALCRKPRERWERQSPYWRRSAVSPGTPTLPHPAVRAG